MRPIHILLLEDEPELSKTISFALKKQGAIITAVRTILAAEKEISKQSFVLFIFDRMLPDGDGAIFCETIRKKGITIPVLMLTAKTQISDRVNGLKSGADDYLCKPFSLEELNARIEALLRRSMVFSSSTPSNNNFSKSEEVPLWRLDSNLFQVMGPKGIVSVTPLEFKLLTHLITQPGQTIKREDLLKHVWGYRFLPQTRTVDYFMSRIRKRFENDPENPIHFKTIRGVGYRFDLN